MPGRYVLAAAVVVALSGLPGCGEDPDALACDVLTRLEASADPLGDAVLGNPARLRTASADIVATYDELDRVAPSALQSDTRRLSDTYRTIDALFATVGYDAAALEASPVAAARLRELTGPAFQSSVGAVVRFGIANCGITVVGRPAP
jgi:hypothetical protein